MAYYKENPESWITLHNLVSAVQSSLLTFALYNYTATQADYNLPVFTEQ